MLNSDKIKSLKNNLFKVKIKLSSGIEKNTSLLKKIRHEIARLKTESNDKTFVKKIKKTK